MAEKQYTLISSEPLNDFEKAVLEFLESTKDDQPRAFCAVGMSNDPEVMSATYFYNTNFEDLTRMKAQLELDVIHQTIEANIDYYADLIDTIREDQDWDEEEGDDDE